MPGRPFFMPEAALAAQPGRTMPEDETVQNRSPLAAMQESSGDASPAVLPVGG